MPQFTGSVPAVPPGLRVSDDAQIGGDVDVVISDHLMPSMDGLTFLKMIKNLYPDTIRIILTGHADLQMAIEAINEGQVFRFLTKPCQVAELASAITDGLSQRNLDRQRSPTDCQAALGAAHGVASD